jgi:hypothetical protein
MRTKPFLLTLFALFALSLLRLARLLYAEARHPLGGLPRVMPPAKAWRANSPAAKGVATRAGSVSDRPSARRRLLPCFTARSLTIARALSRPMSASRVWPVGELASRG